MAGSISEILHKLLYSRHIESVKELYIKFSLSRNVTPKVLELNTRLALQQGFLSNELERRGLSFTELDTSFTEPYEKPIRKLREIQGLRTPLSKLRSLATLNTTICACIETFWRNRSPPSALPIDPNQYFSLLLYLLLKADSPELFVDLLLLNELRRLGLRMGSAGYCFTTLMNAYEYILSAEFTTVVTKSIDTNFERVLKTS
eukprot:TRINITY_DN9330_c0_g1_i10.p1 TRINITY_DN9330_c0_g1~~TRINITY_DN9330_c0_g1_i10.p1  ORF type:complete len:203 (+),score=47.46 TRINITY_DN9330_c0_g1_i10:217-825(+)